MQEQYNYVAVPSAAWDLLYGWYGGGPLFRRCVIGQGRQEQAIIEMYPLSFHVTKATLKGEEPVLTQQDLSDPTQGWSQVREGGGGAGGAGDN
jgi:hypothetical protein